MYQMVALLLLHLGAGGSGTRMCLVDDDHLRAFREEKLTSLVGLDIVDGDNLERIKPKDAGITLYPAIQPGGSIRPDDLGVETEFFFQFTVPLVAQMGRADYGKTFYQATVVHLTYDEQGFDGFADPDVVGYQQAYDLLSQPHNERYQLIGAWTYREPTEGAKGSRPRAQGEPRGVVEELGGLEVG